MQYRKIIYRKALWPEIGPDEKRLIVSQASNYDIPQIEMTAVPY
jgi:hypothetical protein